MTDEVYVHYGSTRFDPSRMTSLDKLDADDVGAATKPPHYSAIWGSPVSGERSWKHWNEVTRFSKCDEDNSFQFKISDMYKILIVDSHSSAISLVENYCKLYRGFTDLYGFGIDTVKQQCVDYINSTDAISGHCIPALDFLKMSADGYSGMEISITKFPKLYWLLYSWDCDSIVVWNPDAIIQV